jgi:anti-anti-sigma factor
MGEATPSLKVHEEEGITSVQFRDDKLVDAVAIAQVQQELNSLIVGKERPLVLIDFYNVDQLSSACLGALLALHKKIKEQHGQLRLANIQPKLMKIFELTKLHEVLRISATRTGAMSILQRVASEATMDSP